MDSLPEWLELTRAPYFKKLVLHAKRAVQKQLETNDAFQEEAAAALDRTFVCAVCSSAWASEGDLRNHQHRAHGMFNESRRFIVSNMCLVCLTSFGNRNRLVHHYRSFPGRSCLEVLQKIYVPLSNETVSCLDAKALADVSKSVCKHSGKPRPAIKLSGPRIAVELAPSEKLMLTCPGLGHFC